VNARGLSLTTKIFLATAAVVAAVLGATLVVANMSARRTADQSVNKTLAATRDLVSTQLAAREKMLRGSAEVFVQNSQFRSIIESKSAGDALDQAQEAKTQTGADWIQLTDDRGIRTAKTDDPTALADTLTGSALIGKALEGQTVVGYGNPTDTSLFQAVSVPIIGAARVVGVLMAVRWLDSTFAVEVRRAGGSEVDIVFFALDGTNQPRAVASTLGRGPDVTRLLADIAGADMTADSTMRVERDINNHHFVGLVFPLKAASGHDVGGVIVLRDRDKEFAAFNRLEAILLVGGAAGLVIAGLLSFAIARQITRPVGQLVDATRRAAEGDYSADIDVNATGEIGTLADAFRAMLADLRDKAALIEFLGGSSPDMAKTVRIQASTRSAQAVHQSGITPGARFAQRYEVKEMLGVGGMGMVFKAVDSELNEVIAIKTLKQDILSKDTSALDRFKSEIRLARKISHRNVVRTYDFGEFSGVYYITMEYVEGKSLKELISTRGRLPVAATLTVAKQLCRALEVAHEQGIIHRDIKPQNMVVEPDGVLKVMDFGIARLAKRQSGMTQQGVVVGTPEYMAPEQLMGDTIDVRADIYAAGCVIYECLTGGTPLTAENQITLIAKVLDEMPIPPRVVNHEVPQALSDLVMRTLSKKPAERPQTAIELHDLLAAIG
jgi:serine/threonine-protein kinase